jgi:hypothetical protein
VRSENRELPNSSRKNVANAQCFSKSRKASESELLVRALRSGRLRFFTDCGIDLVFSLFLSLSCDFWLKKKHSTSPNDNNRKIPLYHHEGIATTAVQVLLLSPVRELIAFIVAKVRITLLVPNAKRRLSFSLMLVGNATSQKFLLVRTRTPTCWSFESNVF